MSESSPATITSVLKILYECKPPKGIKKIMIEKYADPEIEWTPIVVRIQGDTEYIKRVMKRLEKEKIKEVFVTNFIL